VTQSDRYILRQLVFAMTVVAGSLTCVAWLTQSLRFVEMIINRGMSGPLFVYFTLLLLPTFFAFILPVALFAAIMFVYHRLTSDSELIVLRAAGVSNAALARPVVYLATVTMLLVYCLTLYAIPTSFRAFKELQFHIRNSYTAFVLHEGVFNVLMKGITVYVRSRSSTGELMGIIVNDDRLQERSITMMAERGAIVAGEKGPRVILGNGNRQEIRFDDGSVSLLYFDNYTFEIASLGESAEDRWREPRERYLDELFFPSDKENEVWRYHQLRMEGHYRLASPLLAVTFALVGLAFILGGQFNRRGNAVRIVLAVVVVTATEAALLGAKSLGEKVPAAWFLVYLTALAPAAACAYDLATQRMRRAPRRPVDA
jgi:lipopolysaccharide export system permease protein